MLSATVEATAEAPARHGVLPRSCHVAVHPAVKLGYVTPGFAAPAYLAEKEG